MHAELEFHKRVVPTSIHIYETYHPGAVVKILACNADRKDKVVKRSGEVEYVLITSDTLKCRVFLAQLVRCYCSAHAQIQIR